MKVLKTITKYILTTILTVLIISYLLLNIASSTILSKSYILSKLEETDYYNKIYENVKSNFENYIHQSGLEEEVLEDIVTKEKIEKDIKIIINNIYEGTNQKIETEEIKNNLEQKIEQAMGYKTMNITQKNAIDTYIEKICNEYISTISHSNYEQQINQIYQKVTRYIELGKKVLLISIIIIVIVLIILNLKKIYEVLCIIGTALTSTGTFLVIINLFINTKVKIQNITLLNDAFSNVIRNIASEILETIQKNGILLLIVGIILIVFSITIKNIKQYKKEKNKQKEIS